MLLKKGLAMKIMIIFDHAIIIYITHSWTCIFVSTKYGSKFLITV